MNENNYATSALKQRKLFEQGHINFHKTIAFFILNKHSSRITFL